MNRVTPSAEAHRRWCHGAARAVEALRLNQHFPPRDVVVAYLQAIAEEPGPWDAARGLPAGPAWVAADAAREEAPAARERWASIPQGELSAAQRDSVISRLAAVDRLAALPPLRRREVQVALRHRGASRASYEVVVDRFDPASTTLARYTLHLVDTPGPRLDDGELELRAANHFADGLARLTDQDAALAFAVLGGKVVAVESVVRGVIGPGLAEDGVRVGPPGVPVAGGLILSACLERASIDLTDGVVDDPLTGSVVVPEPGQAFGISRRRKWAAPERDAAALRGWLASIGSRNLVYGYDDGA